MNERTYVCIYLFMCGYVCISVCLCTPVHTCVCVCVVCSMFVYGQCVSLRLSIHINVHIITYTYNYIRKLPRCDTNSFPPQQVQYVSVDIGNDYDDVVKAVKEVLVPAAQTTVGVLCAEQVVTVEVSPLTAGN